MNLKYDLKYDCLKCETSLKYLLSNYSGNYIYFKNIVCCHLDCMTCDWVNLSHGLSNSKHIQLNINLNTPKNEEIKSHLSKNIYDQGNLLFIIKFFLIINRL